MSDAGADGHGAWPLDFTQVVDRLPRNQYAMTPCVEIHASPNFKIEGSACFLVELHEANVIQVPQRIHIREARLDFHLMRIDSEIQSACMGLHGDSQAPKFWDW